MFYPTENEIKSWMIPFSKLYIKYSYLETRHKSTNMCYDVFSLHNQYTLFSYPSHNLIIK